MATQVQNIGQVYPFVNSTVLKRQWLPHQLLSARTIRNWLKYIYWYCLSNKNYSVSNLVLQYYLLGVYIYYHWQSCYQDQDQDRDQDQDQDEDRERSISRERESIFSFNVGTELQLAIYQLPLSTVCLSLLSVILL